VIKLVTKEEKLQRLEDNLQKKLKTLKNKKKKKPTLKVVKQEEE
tara:strand:- start:4695 stop:4826 length:132 start_codon:yes stop_codon:yes gene_type:complete